MKHKTNKHKMMSQIDTRDYNFCNSIFNKQGFQIDKSGNFGVANHNNNKTDSNHHDNIPNPNPNSKSKSDSNSTLDLKTDSNTIWYPTPVLISSENIHNFQQNIFTHWNDTFVGFYVKYIHYEREPEEVYSLAHTRFDIIKNFKKIKINPATINCSITLHPYKFVSESLSFRLLCVAVA